MPIIHKKNTYPYDMRIEIRISIFRNIVTLKLFGQKNESMFFLEMTR